MKGNKTNEFNFRSYSKLVVIKPKKRFAKPHPLLSYQIMHDSIILRNDANDEWDPCETVY